VYSVIRLNHVEGEAEAITTASAISMAARGGETLTSPRPIPNYEGGGKGGGKTYEMTEVEVRALNLSHGKGWVGVPGEKREGKERTKKSYRKEEKVSTSSRTDAREKK